ncbi:hypothetical protein IWQ60_003580 [Tieghemiomyces parasiticus]|uniref:glucan 1,4-alpha-glucosidase n=1 Tax=Tieghemiomyces parasiticus TaxID=78921 RepID=A0A9W8DZX7_9FUNG|nr:hypothetical protein IWQ60_003580 [Tieghemiomyces parasiticus]
MKLSLLFAVTQTWLACSAITHFEDPRPVKRVRLVKQGTGKAVYHVPLEDYLAAQFDHALLGIQQAVSPPEAARGAMQASPSREHPNYFYHWVRDTGLVMDLVADLYAETSDQREQERWGTILADHATFSRGLQLVPNQSGGPGEPKFYMNGTAFQGTWGRPQNDGPAVRAFAITKYGETWAHRGGDLSTLYRPDLPTTTVIKTDLEYTAHHWDDPSFDIWEEVRGRHFFNLLASRKALLVGAELADRQDDSGAAEFYRNQAALIRDRLDSYWDPELGYVVTSRNRDEGVSKSSNLDVQVVVAAIHAGLDDGIYTPESDRILATADAITRRFQYLFPVNQQQKTSGIGPAIGRYPEDVYDGYGVSIGNPWVLATAYLAELHYYVAAKWHRDGHFTLTAVNLSFFRRASPTVARRFGADSLRDDNVGVTFDTHNAEFRAILKEVGASGDGFLRRIHYHSRGDLNLYEQWDRVTGQARGAKDLTWSYAAFVRAVRARKRLQL